MVTDARIAQGWYQDPYQEHEDRYFSGGQPTKLVRDRRLESFDPPPDLPVPGPLVPASSTGLASGPATLRRADDAEREPAYDRRVACDTAISAAIRHGVAD
jgi:hypothetical protein